MTVRELKEKLSFYKDDVEVFVGHYDDLQGSLSYQDPVVSTENVEAWFTKAGHLCYSKWQYRDNAKKDVILTIG